MESLAIRVGVIGVGGMGGTHTVNRARLVQGSHVEAVMDANLVRAQEIAALCNDAHIDAHIDVYLRVQQSGWAGDL